MGKKSIDTDFMKITILGNYEDIFFFIFNFNVDCWNLIKFITIQENDL